MVFLRVPADAVGQEKRKTRAHTHIHTHTHTHIKGKHKLIIHYDCVFKKIQKILQVKY